MEKLTPEAARRLLAHVEQGGAARLGIIQGGGGASQELKRIIEARKVVAQDDANKKK